MQDKYEATTTPTPSQETLPQGVPENSFLEIQKIKEKRKRLPKIPTNLKKNGCRI